MEEDIARILVEMGMIYEKMGKLAAAENVYKRSLAYWQSISDSIWQPTILNNLGVVQHMAGDFSGSFHNLEKRCITRKPPATAAWRVIPWPASATFTKTWTRTMRRWTPTIRPWIRPSRWKITS
jgi:hypothetical protein